MYVCMYHFDGVTYLFLLCQRLLHVLMSGCPEPQPLVLAFYASTARFRLILNQFASNLSVICRLLVLVISAKLEVTVLARVSFPFHVTIDNV